MRSPWCSFKRTNIWKLFPPIYSVYLDFNTKSMMTERPKPTLRSAVMDVTAKLWSVFKPSDVSSFVTQELFLTVEKCFLLCNFHLKQTKHPICWHSWYAYIYYSSYSHTVIILKWCFDLNKKNYNMKTWLSCVFLYLYFDFYWTCLHAFMFMPNSDPTIWMAQHKDH